MHFKATCLIILSIVGSTWPGLGVQTSGQNSTPSEAAVGAVRIKTDVSEVRVWIDQKEVGITPLSLKSVPVGKHELMLVKDGYEESIHSIEVSVTKPVSIFAVLKPLAIELPPFPIRYLAAHQHKFGYCAGVLTITADAIEFRSDKDKDDVFHIPFQTVQSVARSFGPVPGVGGISGDTDLMACRIETPGRAYGFWAYQKSLGDEMTVVAEETKKLHRIAYLLWVQTLKGKSR